MFIVGLVGLFCVRILIVGLIGFGGICVGLIVSLIWLLVLVLVFWCVFWLVGLVRL